MNKHLDGVCSRLNACPEDTKSQSLEPVNVIWKKKVFADVIKLRISRWGDYPGLPESALNAIIRVLIGERQTEVRYRHRREGKVKMDGDWHNAAVNKGMRAVTRNRKRQDVSFPSANGGSGALWTPWFQPNETDFRLLASRTASE